MDIKALNYAKEYQTALEQAYPYALYFGALFATPNNGRYRWLNSNTIEIPSIRTSGRIDGNRDTIGAAKRNYDNEWTPLKLSNHRTWKTLVHPRDIAETGGVATIANITNTFNNEQKFPEINAYCVSKLFADWTGLGKTADSEALTTENVLLKIDAFMTAMDEARVPRQGRILYVTPVINALINEAKGLARNLDVTQNTGAISRAITSLEELEIQPSVPSDMMKTKYDFTEGWKPANDAKQIQMFMVHPTAVITPISYEFARLDPPSANSDGKYVYFEESFEDAFVLKNKVDALMFSVTGE